MSRQSAGLYMSIVLCKCLDTRNGVCNIGTVSGGRLRSEVTASSKATAFMAECRRKYGHCSMACRVIS